ncbi:hypothetical protein [Anaerococcus sp.]|uniref:hypothetical protein n=1 Tax=Anaerococcus sp. TaxID=1872515 RepID=UPI0027B9ECEE|nr:hypothetical protein [Anaerococcus sp.]
MQILLMILSLVNGIFSIIRDNDQRIIYSYKSMGIGLMTIVVSYCFDAEKISKEDLTYAMDVVPTMAKVCLGFAVLLILINGLVIYRYWKEIK